MRVPSRHPKSNVLQKQEKKENIIHPPTTSSLLERRTCILFVLSCFFAFSYWVANENSASNLILTGELLSRTHILSTATRMLGCRLSCLFVPCRLHWDLFKGCSHVSFCLVPSELGAEYGAVCAEHKRPHWVTWQTILFPSSFVLWRLLTSWQQKHHCLLPSERGWPREVVKTAGLG